jgi:L-ascorbate metabolism protein UlaG (beta-lactamase superfamily)
MPRLALAAAVVLFAGTRCQAGELTATFIGNAAFHITDGKLAILADFPYESGAFGYMEWSPEQIPKGPKPLCLFTHAHKDHVALDQVSRFCELVVGPAEVVRLAGVKALPLADPVRWGDLTINPIATPHGAIEHYSYLVEWQGQRLYFSGDTDDSSALLRARDLDVAFVNPWLLKAIAGAGSRLDASRIVTCHHKPAEAVQDLQGRIVPAQGQVLRLASTRAAAQAPGPVPAPQSVPIAPPEDDGFTAPFKEAVRNVQAGAGQEFMQGPFSQHFYQLYSSRLSECMGQTGGTAASDFEMAVKLAADGRVEAAVVRPRSKLATCFADSVSRDTFAAPPSPGFWVPLGIRFTKK